ncbi:MAG: hypothetical protein LBJ11_00680 [Oscillospiraceae bacterium]|nr:hypothetical protein [Oscillospiraceae bacterium]
MSTTTSACSWWNDPWASKGKCCRCGLSFNRCRCGGRPPYPGDGCWGDGLWSRPPYPPTPGPGPFPPNPGPGPGPFPPNPGPGPCPPFPELPDYECCWKPGYGYGCGCNSGNRPGGGYPPYCPPVYDNGRCRCWCQCSDYPRPLYGSQA